MSDSGQPRQPDPLLHSFLVATAPREADRCVALLIREHADGVVLSIIRRKLKIALGRMGGATQTQDEQNAEDVHGAAIAQIVGRLNLLRADPIDVIADFCGYAAVVASNACDAFLRRKYPKRQFVKNRLRYLLGNSSGQTGIVSWQGARGETLCGFEAWRESERAVERGGRYRQMTSAPLAFLRTALGNEDPRQGSLAVLIAALLNRVGGPVELDDLVQVVAEVLEIKDREPVAEVENSGDDRERPEDRAAAPGPRVSETTVGRMYLQSLWEQVCELGHIRRGPSPG